MVETPGATQVIRTTVTNHEDPDAPLLSVDEKAPAKAQIVEEELFTIKAKPITSKLRTTIQHLRSRAGWSSRFRGLGVAAIYHSLHWLVMNLFISFLGSAPIPATIASVGSAVLLCRIKMVWTHIVISEPSSETWAQRLPERKIFKKIAGPTAYYALALQLSVYAPVLMAKSFGLDQYVNDPSHFGDISPEARLSVMTEALMVFLIGFGAVVSVLIPAKTMLTRVHASMLPEKDEPIVPFDRTFDGRVISEELGGTGNIGMLEAWKTYDRSSRFNLLKLYAKVLAIQTAVTMLFVGIGVAELQLIMGDQLLKVAELARAKAIGAY